MLQVISQCEATKEAYNYQLNLINEMLRLVSVKSMDYYIFCRINKYNEAMKIKSIHQLIIWIDDT